jgi:hypothetical protein
MQVETIRSLVQRGASRHPELRCKLEHAAFISVFRAVTPQLDGSWLVASEREDGRLYTVRLNAEPGTSGCTCQDAQRREAQDCKHSLAVLMVFRALADELGLERARSFFDGDQKPSESPTPIGAIASGTGIDDDAQRDNVAVFERFRTP